MAERLAAVRGGPLARAAELAPGRTRLDVGVAVYPRWQGAAAEMVHRFRKGWTGYVAAEIGHEVGRGWEAGAHAGMRWEW